MDQDNSLISRSETNLYTAKFLAPPKGSDPVARANILALVGIGYGILALTREVSKMTELKA